MCNHRLNRVILIIFDVVFNTLSSEFQYHSNLLLSLYIYLFQDLFLLLAIMTILLQFFREDILESNLARALLAKNWKTLVFILIYFAQTITLQALNATAIIAQNNADQETLLSTSGSLTNSTSDKSRLLYQILTILQRLTAILFYFFLSKTDKCLHKSQQNIPKSALLGYP